MNHHSRQTRGNFRRKTEKSTHSVWMPSWSPSTGVTTSRKLPKIASTMHPMTTANIRATRMRPAGV